MSSNSKSVVKYMSCDRREREKTVKITMKKMEIEQWVKQSRHSKLNQWKCWTVSHSVAPEIVEQRRMTIMTKQPTESIKNRFQFPKNKFTLFNAHRAHTQHCVCVCVWTVNNCKRVEIKRDGVASACMHGFVRYGWVDYIIHSWVFIMHTHYTRPHRVHGATVWGFLLSLLEFHHSKMLSLFHCWLKSVRFTHCCIREKRQAKSTQRARTYQTIRANWTVYTVIVSLE